MNPIVIGNMAFALFLPAGPLLRKKFGARPIYLALQYSMMPPYHDFFYPECPAQTPLSPHSAEVGSNVVLPKLQGFCQQSEPFLVKRFFVCNLFPTFSLKN